MNPVTQFRKAALRVRGIGDAAVKVIAIFSKTRSAGLIRKIERRRDRGPEQCVVVNRSAGISCRRFLAPVSRVQAVLLGPHLTVDNRRRLPGYGIFSGISKRGQAAHRIVAVARRITCRVCQLVDKPDIINYHAVFMGIGVDSRLRKATFVIQKTRRLALSILACFQRAIRMVRQRLLQLAKLGNRFEIAGRFVVTIVNRHATGTGFRHTLHLS